MGEAALLPARGRPTISSELIGMSAAMGEIRKAVSELAKSEATVLVTGESGTGKENVARALHAASPARARGSFEAVNCGAIPADLAEAELFGAEAGAYTGASRTRIGRLEAAAGGTLFLDEIGDLPLPLQVKLLRAIETREIQRLGATKPIPVDFRLVCATNVDLDRAVRAGRFREDLYWRIAVVWLELPPLAARREDIPALAQHFARLSRQRLHLTDDGIAALSAHRWPGNLRELRNLVDRALALGIHVLDGAAVGTLLSPRRRPFGDWVAEGSAGAPAAPGDSGAGNPGSGDSVSGDLLSGDSLAVRLAAAGEPLTPVALRALLLQAEALLIRQALQQSATVAESARLLGVKRTTLVEKMKRMGLSAANEAA